MIIDSLAVKEQILQKFMQLAGESGWSQENLVRACEICEILPSYLPLIFENGLIDLEDFFLRHEVYGQLDRAAASQEFISLHKLHEKITHLLICGLVSQSKHKAALRNLAKINFYPKKIFSKETGLLQQSQALKMIYQIADWLWKLAEDQSTDFNFYSKRLILSKIILSSFSTFLDDDTANLEKTRQVISQEIAAVLKFSKAKKFFIEKVKSRLKTGCEFVLDDEGGARHFSEIIKSIPFLRCFAARQK